MSTSNSRPAYNFKKGNTDDFLFLRQYSALYKQAQKAFWLEVVLSYAEESLKLRKLSVL